jgi:hypothetical protein
MYKCRKCGKEVQDYSDIQRDLVVIDKEKDILNTVIRGENYVIKYKNGTTYAVVTPLSWHFCKSSSKRLVMGVTEFAGIDMRE